MRIRTMFFRTCIIGILSVCFLSCDDISLIDLAMHGPYTKPRACFVKTYGGPDADSAAHIIETTGGQYLLAGSTVSFGGGLENIWALKLDGAGDIIWQTAVGGSNSDVGYRIWPTADGGCIIGGSTKTFVAGETDLFFVRLNADGSHNWSRNYNGNRLEYPGPLIPTADGGYIFHGSTNTFSTDFTFELIAAKLDASFNITWQKRYDMGGYYGQCYGNICQTSDGGYIIGASSYVSSTTPMNYDIWVLKLFSTGVVEWQRCYTATGSQDDAGNIIPCSDGGYLYYGATKSFGEGLSDMLVLKLDGAGGIQWQETLGDVGDESAGFAVQTPDCGFVVVGTTNSLGAGGNDMLMIKLSAAGVIEWQKTYGGIGNENGFAVSLTSDGYLLVSGRTDTFGAGGFDAWILKLNTDGTPFGVPVTLISNTASFTASTPTYSVYDVTATMTNRSPNVVTTDAQVSTQYP